MCQNEILVYVNSIDNFSELKKKQKFYVLNIHTNIYLVILIINIHTKKCMYKNHF